MLRVSRPALSSLLDGKAGLSGEMALRMEKAFGVRMETLMRMQSAYDIAQTAAAKRKSQPSGAFTAPARTRISCPDLTVEGP